MAPCPFWLSRKEVRTFYQHVMLNRPTASVIKNCLDELTFQAASQSDRFALGDELLIVDES
jgi:hypothetical protein